MIVIATFDIQLASYRCIVCSAFVAFITYFIIGAVVLRVKYQRTGSDLIINKAFWKDFPFLLKVNM